MKFQHTLARPVEASGIGLHSAVDVRIRLLPAPASKGIVFRRIDLDDFEIPASWKHIARVSYATSLMRRGVLISTTEHLLSVLMAMEIDNAIIEINSLELPILDGSGAPILKMIEQAGRRQQRAPRQYMKILEAVEVVDGAKRIAVYPYDGFRISSSIDFPHPLVGNQQLEMEMTPEEYAREIAPARTFGFLDQISQLKDMGLVRGGSLANAVVFSSDSIMNSEGLRFPDECSRHKVLDLIGDLALIGYPLRAHVVAERAGHAMHTALVLKLVQDRSLWELVTLPESNLSLMSAPSTMELQSAASD
ncbi:MAG: UDP-3-O-[3-hydroxymyristoyl] N-acetylglucosamine deacetylase [Acidobacteria bacterium RIFCSPLOWO2_12_FULL_54_10]|nr:MAG: UDP-3-O-[3-hydroxymyristoyl] N-acetylglucosamine deacetylase [Acidobacteria bacterium RIFCSPLOWO2_12_FULL_54_10]